VQGQLYHFYSILIAESMLYHGQSISVGGAGGSGGDDCHHGNNSEGDDDKNKKSKQCMVSSPECRAKS
jgi:hypothetical protein